MSAPEITVIIPTRERRETLEKALLTVTNQDYKSLRIIVSDNFSADGTGDFVRGLQDRRITYLNTGRRVSMSENWEFALSSVSTGWVTIMGDDDGLLPGALERLARMIEANRVRAIRTSVCAYAWPSITGKNHGRLAVPLGSGHEIRNATRWLRKVLAGGTPYTELPMLYNGGYVDVSVLQEIKRRTGRFYKSCVPDVYSAISIASVLESYIFSRTPSAINGASRHSTGTSYFAVERQTGVTPAQLFAAEGNIPFHDEMPLCRDGTYPPSVNALIYESYMQSRALRAEPHRSPSAMLAVILAYAGRHEPRLRDWARDFAERHGLNLESIRAAVSVSRPKRAMQSLWQQMGSRINTYSLGSRDFPIYDVYQASITAAAVRDIGIGRLKNLRRLLRRSLDSTY